MKVVFDNLANFLSISPNQTPVFAVCLLGPSRARICRSLWTLRHRSENRFHMKNWFWRGHGTWAPRFHTYFLIDSRNRFFIPLHDYKYQLWTFLPFLFLLILYSLPCMYTLYNVDVLTPTCTVQYCMWSAELWIYGYSCTHAFLLWGPNTHPLNFLNDIGRNCLLGNRKKIAKF